MIRQSSGVTEVIRWLNTHGAIVTVLAVCVYACFSLSLYLSLAHSPLLLQLLLDVGGLLLVVLEVVEVVNDALDLLLVALVGELLAELGWREKKDSAERKGRTNDRISRDREMNVNTRGQLTRRERGGR